MGRTQELERLKHEAGRHAPGERLELVEHVLGNLGAFAMPFVNE